MPRLPTTSDLPYHLPKNSEGQLRELAKILDIAPQVAMSSGEKGLEAMCAAMMYRHLDRNQRMEAMRVLRSVTNPSLQQKLVTLALDTTFLNPQWGMWSLTNEELEEDETFHLAIDNIGSVLGITLSVAGIKDLTKELWTQKKFTRGHKAMVVIWLVFAANKAGLSAVQREKAKRTQMKSSVYH